MMPDRDCGAVELWDYNRQAGAEADRVRDFLCSIMSPPGREPFWRMRRRPSRPPRSPTRSALFGERGRLPITRRKPSRATPGWRCCSARA